jgi:hypothetical protein
MRKIPWDMQTPGHFEVDLVNHCEASAVGEYIHTLQMVDVATGWSELAAIYGRSYRVMANGFDFILSRLPFLVLEIHPDNGPEFFNAQLIRFWGRKVADLVISRSRPYQKNDNRFVEENNHSLVRAYISHGRLDTQTHLEVLRQLYDKLWLYHNFFQPVLRLQEKIYLNDLQYRRKFDPTCTPFDRLKNSGCLSQPVLSRLDFLRAQTNLLALRSQIDQLITRLLSLPVLDHTETVNIFQNFLKEADPLVTLSFEPTTPVR